MKAKKNYKATTDHKPHLLYFLLLLLQLGLVALVKAKRLHLNLGPCVACVDATIGKRRYKSYALGLQGRMRQDLRDG